MTRKEATGVIKFEKACVLRQDTPQCHRDCKKCDLLLPTEDVLTAYDMAIKALEQEQKTGHWIEHPEIETSTPEYLMFYECSECGDKQCFCKSDIHKKHFCNNCGARMVEPQESEEV